MPGADRGCARLDSGRRLQREFRRRRFSAAQEHSPCADRLASAVRVRPLQRLRESHRRWPSAPGAAIRVLTVRNGPDQTALANGMARFKTAWPTSVTNLANLVHTLTPPTGATQWSLATLRHRPVM